MTVTLSTCPNIIYIGQSDNTPIAKNHIFCLSFLPLAHEPAESHAFLREQHSYEKTQAGNYAARLTLFSLLEPERLD